MPNHERQAVIESLLAIAKNGNEGPTDVTQISHNLFYWTPGVRFPPKKQAFGDGSATQG
jgi:hypothetical protein